VRVDGQRVLLAAAQAALEEARLPPRRPRRRVAVPARSVLLGAGLVAGWRLLARRRGRDVLRALEERLLEYEETHFARDDAGGGAAVSGEGRASD